MHRYALFLALIAGCDGDGPGSDDTDVTDDTGTESDTDTDTDSDTDTDTDSDTDTDTNPWTGDDNGDEVPTTTPDQTVTGNLTDGSTLSSLNWATGSPNYCWPSTENPNFDGAHVFTHRTLGDEIMYLRLVPEAGKDMSLYFMQLSDGDDSVPPNATIAGSGDCDGMYDAQGDNNPGQPEAIAIDNRSIFPTYNLMIGVAGANGLTEGDYTLEIWRE